MAVNDLITFRKGTASEWISANPVLASGEPGYDLTNSVLKIGDGVSSWAALSGIGSTSVGGSSSSSVGVRGVISTTGNLTNFAVSGGYSPGYLDLFQNGVKLLSGSDFTATDGTSVTLSNSVPSGTILEYTSLAASVSSSNYTKLDSIGSSFNGLLTSFGLSVSGTPYYPVSANTLGIYVGGVAQEPISSYSVSGSNIVFTEAPASGLTFWGVGYGTTAVATLNGIVPGSSGSPAISSSNDLTSGFYFPSSGNISVAGNLGIGTSSPSTLLDINNNKFRVRNSKTPSSDTDTGNTGDICWDSNYIYVCTATNNWARSVISRWYNDPTSYSGLQLWLDASDSSTLFDSTSGGSVVNGDGAVARWQDKSGNSRHATQSTSEARPVRKTSVQNGRDALRFDGSNDALTTSTNYHVSDLTIFVVAKRTSGTGAFFQTGNTSGLGYAAGDSITSGFDNCYARGVTNGQVGSITSTSWRVISVTYTEGSRKVYIQGTLVDTTSFTISTPNSSNGVASWIGAIDAAGYFLNGDIGEIAAYNIVLSDTNRGLLESYLMNKWAIT